MLAADGLPQPPDAGGSVSATTRGAAGLRSRPAAATRLAAAFTGHNTSRSSRQLFQEGRAVCQSF